MHIMEGFLPHPWWEIWFAVTTPIVAYGVYRLSATTKNLAEAKPLLALMGAFIFVVSALKLPSVLGSSSHPTGAGLAAVIFGPSITGVLATIALVFQTLLLAHGGLTTLGANVFSMGIVGPTVAVAVWFICKRTKLPTSPSIFLAVAASDLATYVATSAQLALAFPSTGFLDALLRFGAVFAITQIPLAIAEGIFAVFIFDFLSKYKGHLLASMKVIHLPIYADDQKPKRQLKTIHYVLLTAVLVILFVVPLILFPNMEFGGTDNAVAEIITGEGYTPWFNPIWQPPSSIESLLFTLQAVIGAVIIGYIVGYERGKRAKKQDTQNLHQKENTAHKVGHSNLSVQIDRYAYTNALSKSSPTTKILFALSTLLLSVLSPSPVVPIAVFILNAILLLHYARIPARFYRNLIVYPTIIVVVSSIFIALFFGYGTPFVQLSFPWFKWTIYSSGINMAITTFFRVEGAISCTYFLVLTTSVTDIFITLRRIRIPKALVEMSLLIYRYIFVFIEVSSKMSTAQKMRLGHSSWIKKIRSTAMLVGNLFIRTLEQGERTFIAMSARGYDGNIHILEEMPRSKKTTLVGIILLDVVLVLVALTVNFGVA